MTAKSAPAMRGTAGKLTPVPEPRVTAAELRDADLRLVRARADAAALIGRLLEECPALPGISGHTAISALDPERQRLARQLMERLGQIPAELAGTA